MWDCGGTAEEASDSLRGGQLDFAIEMFFEEGEKAFRERFGGERIGVSIFEDVIEEFIGEGREVVDLRRTLLRRGKSALKEHGETESAHVSRF